MPKDTFFYKNSTINCNGKLLLLDEPALMGILNITPDSFYDGGRYQNDTAILKKVESMVEDGATIIDIGSYSSRPSAQHISESDELNRILPGLKLIKTTFPDIAVSIDTFRSSIAETCINEGASIINDISGGTMDARMFETVARLNVPYILMHMRGTPQTMTKHTDYKDVTEEVFSSLQSKVNSLHQLGLNDVIIDPGFGFAKNLSQNYELMHNLNHFKLLNCPLLVGISRKSMIYKLLQTNPESALNGTTVLNTIGLLQGASILRVHDVKEAKEILKIVHQLKNS